MYVVVTARNLTQGNVKISPAQQQVSYSMQRKLFSLSTQDCFSFLESFLAYAFICAVLKSPVIGDQLDRGNSVDDQTEI